MNNLSLSNLHGLGVLRAPAGGLKPWAEPVAPAARVPASMESKPSTYPVLVSASLPSQKLLCAFSAGLLKVKSEYDDIAAKTLSDRRKLTKLLSVLVGGVVTDASPIADRKAYLLLKPSEEKFQWARKRLEDWVAASPGWRGGRRSRKEIFAEAEAMVRECAKLVAKYPAVVPPPIAAPRYVPVPAGAPAGGLKPWAEPVTPPSTTTPYTPSVPKEPALPGPFGPPGGYPVLPDYTRKPVSMAPMPASDRVYVPPPFVGPPSVTPWMTVDDLGKSVMVGVKFPF